MSDIVKSYGELGTNTIESIEPNPLIMIKLRWCGGYLGSWACADDYPDHMVPISEFGISTRDGLQHYCRRCRGVQVKLLNERIAIGEQLVGGRKTWRSMTKEERTKVYVQVEKTRLLNTAPAKEYFDWVDSQKESSIKQRVVSIKTRNSTIYDKLKESYDYTCQVESCQETEVEFAHILRHSHPDSVDSITNGWCICRNHHKAYDSNRMIVETNGDFVRYDVHGKIIEYGRIVYNDLHKVNPKFITLAREYWNDREEQEVG